MSTWINDIYPRSTGLSRSPAIAAIVLGLAAGPLRAGSVSESHPHRPLEMKGAQLLLEHPYASRPRPRLCSEVEIPEFSELTRAWNSLPKRTNWVTTFHRGVPARIAIHQIGDRRVPVLLVLIHGLFGEADNWKHMAGALGSDYRLWLVDLPGCGLSDCPDPVRLGPGGYSTAAMAERVLQAIAACLAEESEPDDSLRLILVGHSLGGMVTLRMFVDQDVHQRHAATLARVQGLLLFAPSDVMVPRPTEAWMTVLGLNGVKAWVGQATGLLPRAIQESLRISYCDPNLASCELAEQGCHMLRHGDHRRALQAMIKDAMPWRAFLRHPDWAPLHVLECAYTNVNVPCLIVWGDRDETLPIAMGYKIKDQVPDARLLILPETMHMIPLERPRICATLVKQFDYQLLHACLDRPQSVNRLALTDLASPPLLGGSRPATRPEALTGAEKVRAGNLAINN